MLFRCGKAYLEPSGSRNAKQYNSSQWWHSHQSRSPWQLWCVVCHVSRNSSLDVVFAKWCGWMKISICALLYRAHVAFGKFSITQASASIFIAISRCMDCISWITIYPMVLLLYVLAQHTSSNDHFSCLTIFQLRSTSMSRYQFPEPQPNSTYLHSGRGGAGNVFRAPRTQPSLSLSKFSSILSSTSKHFSSGRGGAGNIHCASRRDTASVSVNEVLTRHSKFLEDGVYHTGRGGAGNTIASSRPSTIRTNSSSSVESAQSFSSRINSRIKFSDMFTSSAYLGFGSWPQHVVVMRTAASERAAASMGDEKRTSAQWMRCVLRDWRFVD